MRFSDTLPVKIVLLGAGGTGGHIAPHLYRLAYALDREVEIIIIDGDTVERPNLVRQNFCVTDLKQNKARVIAERYSAAFGMEANYVSHYIEDEQELSDLVQCPKIFRPGRARFEEGYTILIGAVDNDKSRVMCHSVFQNARRLIYIDSGNGEYQGQVVCGVKLDGRTFNRPLISVFPTVMESEDKFPTELSCEEAAISAPQSMAANLTAASISQGRNVWVKDLDFSQFTSSDIIDLDEYLGDIASGCTRLVQYANLLRRAQPVAHTTPMFI